MKCNKDTFVQMDYALHTDKYSYMEGMKYLCNNEHEYNFVEGLRLRDMNDKGYVACLGKLLSDTESKEI